MILRKNQLLVERGGCDFFIKSLLDDAPAGFEIKFSIESVPNDMLLIRSMLGIPVDDEYLRKIIEAQDQHRIRMLEVQG